MIEFRNEVLANLAREAYDKIGAGEDIRTGVVRWSTLKRLIDGSPAHYRHALECPEAYDSDTFLLGRAFHVAALEPELYDSTFEIWKGGRRGTNEHKEFVGSAIFRGKEAITLEQHRTARRMARAARRCVAAQPFLSGRAEVSLTYSFEKPAVSDDLPGYLIRCKSRLDLLSDNGAIVDLKGTKDGSPEGFGREMHRYGYHAQAAMYRRGFALATGESSLRPCYLLAVENFEPHVAQLYRIPERELEIGAELVSEALDHLAMCRREDRWGGYFDGIMDLELPHYALPRDEDFDPVTGEVNPNPEVNPWTQEH